MIDKIKKVIDKNKNDTHSYYEYIKSFCESKKAKELFKKNEEFKKLENIIKEKNN
jgi:hypothetical protein